MLTALADISKCEEWWRKVEIVKLTEKVQHLPGEQAYQLLLKYLLCHLALLAHHLLLLTTKDKDLDIQ